MGSSEIYLSYFPFGGTPGMKLRPVLLLTGPIGSVPEVLVAYISSVIPASLLPSDIILDPHKSEHAACNLKHVSASHLHNLPTIQHRNIVRYLARLSSSKTLEVDNKLRQLLNL